MKLLISTALLLLLVFSASCTTTPQQSTGESYTTVGSYSYFCNNFCDTYKNQMCSPPGDTATDYQFEIQSGDLTTQQTSNGYQFWLAHGEAVSLEFKCPNMPPTACSGNGPKSIKLDKSGKIDCSVTSKSNNPNDEHKTLYCKNTASNDSHHHLNIDSFGCGAFYAF